MYSIFNECLFLRAFSFKVLVGTVRQQSKSLVLARFTWNRRGQVIYHTGVDAVEGKNITLVEQRCVPAECGHRVSTRPGWQDHLVGSC